MKRLPLVRRLAAAVLASTSFAGSFVRAENPKAPLVIAVLDFDYLDTSGEPKNQSPEHETRRKNFMEALRGDLQKGGYRVVRLDCGGAPCTIKDDTPSELFEAAQKAGARFLLYGGVHKMSTLIQWLKVQLVNVETNRLVDDRLLSFRGDTDDAWRRAEAFLVEQIKAKELAK